MKRCPECRRDFSDDTLSFCLDDGTPLVDGPATEEPETALFRSQYSRGSSRESSDEPATDIITEPISLAERPNLGASKSKHRSVWLLVLFLGLLIPLGGFFAYRYFSPAKQIQSIAVMPFVNESRNADIEYLSDGMTDTLISNLSQIPNLSVKARSSVFRYKGKETTPRIIGEELGVQAVLTGSVVQRGSSLVLHIELVDAVSENALWSADYNSPMTDLLSLQSEIASDVSQRLKAKLSSADKQKLARNYTENPDAYQLYLKGRFYWNKRTAVENKKAVEYFEQAIALDPTYALAYAALADSYILQLPSISREERFSKARAAATKALEIDETLGEAQTALAEVEVNAWNWPAAERGFKRAIELNPSYPTAWHWHAELLSRLGRHDEAVREIKLAQELDPLSIPINSMVGHVLMMARRYDEAIEQFKKTLEMDRNFNLARVWLIETYIFKGMYEEAITEAEKRIEGPGENPENRKMQRQNLAELREAYKRSGAKGFWEQELSHMTQRQARGENPRPLRMAEIYSNLGDNDKALEWLETIFKERGGDGYLKVDPGLDRLRDDARFQELLRKAGFSA
ncbi:MAG: tetratricopeptide repeat protein [Pyrinomonadaceae bacterium]